MFQDSYLRGFRMDRTQVSMPAQMYMYYANLDDLRSVMGLLDEPESTALPAVLKSAQYGRYGLYCVSEATEIGLSRAPCEKVTCVVLYSSAPVLVAKGISMASSIALAQAKESIDIRLSKCYAALYSRALREIKGLSEEDCELILGGSVPPVGYDSLIFDKVMAEDSDEGEKVTLLPYIWLSKEYCINHETINLGLEDFCDFGRYRITVVNGEVEFEKGADASEMADIIGEVRKNKICNNMSVFLVV